MLRALVSLGSVALLLAACRGDGGGSSLMPQTSVTTVARPTTTRTSGVEDIVDWFDLVDVLEACDTDAVFADVPTVKVVGGSGTGDMTFYVTDEPSLADADCSEFNFTTATLEAGDFDAGISSGMSLNSDVAVLVP